jgi:hypothetical protein
MDKVKCSEAILLGIFHHHKELVKLISSGSFDPQRAWKATGKPQDPAFTKIDCYSIKSLNAWRRKEALEFEKNERRQILTIRTEGAVQE